MFEKTSEYQKITASLVAVLALQLDLQLPYDDFWDQLMNAESIVGFNSSQFYEQVMSQNGVMSFRTLQHAPMDVTSRFTTLLVPFMPK